MPVGAKQLLLAGEHGFNTIGQLFVLLGLQRECAQVQDQSLPGLFRCARFDQMQVLVGFLELLDLRTR